jgi:hypothetical protein
MSRLCPSDLSSMSLAALSRQILSSDSQYCLIPCRRSSAHSSSRPMVPFQTAGQKIAVRSAFICIDVLAVEVGLEGG